MIDLTTCTCDKATRTQIANAVEAQGGDLDDVIDLIETYERVQRRLSAACDLHDQGDEVAAQAAYDELDRDYGKPLDQIAGDHLRKRGEGDDQ
ncbi:MAG TPA: hypothetical protein VIJ66_02425 [Solirubrobacteraceae bacterium]